MKTLFSVLIVISALAAHAQPKQIGVFVALCDNKTQGIIPVGKKIGNGDDPDSNLYWGCSDGFGSFFRRSGRWKVISAEEDVSPAILRRLSLRHVEGDVELVASAYRGADLRQSLLDFETAASSQKFDLVAFIGHNGLMDFDLKAPSLVGQNDTDAVVLCCLSSKYFGERLRRLGCRPILMTDQFMYPGSFLLHAAIERWRSGGSEAEVRAAAAVAYAKNQKISVRAAMGVFSMLPKEP